MNHSETTDHLPAFVSKMKNEGLQSLVIDTFSYYYRKVIRGETGLVHNKDIKPIGLNDIEHAENISNYSTAGEKAFGHAVQITLNGGLGTSMGLTGPKSLLKVKNRQSFLEIILRQTEERKVALALMNSFSTHESTLAALKKINPPRFPLIFQQHKYPKILQNGFRPATWPNNADLEWNPPGHGDVYTALYTSGLLQKLLGQGIKYAFISNSDNLGATMDAALLGYFSENGFPFMMEVAEKTPADIKGGHLAKLLGGGFILREAAQCPQDELDAFRNINFYRFFNTNNIWINLEFLENFLQKNQTIRLTMILNPKPLDPRNENSPGVFQVETAMGAAISIFKGATAIKVPRSRFFPVKKCNDLLAVRSDYFVLSDKGELMVNPARGKKMRPDTIKINLDPRYYGKIDLFDARFKNGIPSLVDCNALTIDGDVFFEKNVTVKNNAIIKNKSKSKAIIKAGSIITHDIVF
jgi:UTP--glucose-1-phosphate uridylyltransferase